MNPARIHLDHEVCCHLFCVGKPRSSLFFTFLSELKRIMQQCNCLFCVNCAAWGKHYRQVRP